MNCVGPSDGEGDGPGEPVGLLEGEGVGPTEGDALGLTDGDDVGPTDGETLGVTVGGGVTEVVGLGPGPTALEESDRITVNQTTAPIARTIPNPRSPPHPATRALRGGFGRGAPAGGGT